MLTSLALAGGALISGGWLSALVTLVVVGLIFWVLWWGLNAINPPEPFKKVGTVILVLVACVYLINFLLGLTGSRLF
jgi:uncharacterized membrane protein YwzB